MSATTTPSPLQTLMLRLLNAERATAGVGPLVLDAELTAAAGVHAEWMMDQDVFSHTGQGGSTPSQRVTAAGYQWTATGENIALVSGSDQVVLDEADVRTLHRNLMASPPHRANILLPRYTQVGLAFVQGDYRGRPAVMVAQNFGTPTAAELADGTGIADPAAPTPEPVPTPTPVPTTPTLPVQTARVTVAAGDVVQHVDVTLGGAAPVVAVVPRG